MPRRMGGCMHEVLFDDCFLDDTGVMIDEDPHPMTMNSPLVWISQSPRRAGVWTRAAPHRERR